MKKLFFIALLVVAFTACSSPQNIVLNDGTIIPTRDSVDYDEDSGVYEYENSDGEEVYVNKDNVKIILPAGDPIPQAPAKPASKAETSVNITTQPATKAPTVDK